MSRYIKGRCIISITLLSLFLLIIACSGSTPEVKLPDQSNTQAQGQSQPTNSSKPIGSARSNPAPMGSEVTVDEMAIKVTEVIAPADTTVENANMFNSTPDTNSQYIMVNLSVTCKKSSDDKCTLSSFDYKVIDSSGVTHDNEFVAGVSGEIEDGDFFGGAAKTGYLIYIVPKDDKGLLLLYSGFLSSEAYLSLYK